jgi:hypothetical protein
VTNRRRRLVWGAIGGLFGLALLVIAILDAIDPDLSGHEKGVSIVALVVVPALGFVLGVTPLWRASHNRAMLVGGGVCAAVVAFFIGVISWGFLFPLSAVLFAVALADFNRALALSGVVARRRLFVLLALVMVGGAFAGFTFPLALLAVAVAVVILGWSLARRRRLKAD